MPSVYVDDELMEVPSRVGSFESLCAALKVPEGCRLGVESVDPETGVLGWAILGRAGETKPGETVRYWEFTPGERFKRFDYQTEAEVEERRAPWESDPDGWKRG